MELVKTEQFVAENLNKIDFDLFVCASGYESRARFMATSLTINAKRKIAFAFDNYREDLARPENDIFFSQNGFQLIVTSGDVEKDVTIQLQHLLIENKQEVNILVDYSCMTRVWYASILKFVSQNKFPAQSVQIYFNYSFSDYIAPPKQSCFNKHVGPIDGFFNLSIPDRPSALVIGLGYIEERAFGLAEYLDVDPILFISDSSVSNEYYNEVIKNNKTLLMETKPDNIFFYPLNNLEYTETILAHVCRDLQENYRVILAPCGPKPFTLLSLITALRNKKVDVWRISGGQNEKPLDKIASGENAIYRLHFK